MEQPTVVNSWNEWDPLEHVIVGRASGTMVQAPERPGLRGLPHDNTALSARMRYSGRMSTLQSVEAGLFRRYRSWTCHAFG